MTKNIGKPCAEKPHARFDEGRVDKPTCLLYPMSLNLSDGKLLGADPVVLFANYLNPLKGFGIPFHLSGGRLEIIRTPLDPLTGKAVKGNDHTWGAFYLWHYPDP